MLSFAEMRLLARQRFSFEDYVELEAMSDVKHEFLDGEVWAMAGGSPEHAAVAANIVRLLGQGLLDQRCRVFSSDLRIRVAATGLGTYPDASVICERVELDPEDRKGHTALNPTFLVEVLSPRTEAYDRGEKLANYQLIPSLREVMLVAHDDRRVDLWRRTKSGWTQVTLRAEDSVELESLPGVRMTIDEIYFDPLAG
jgi:Uma2 family endonuclease